MRYLILITLLLISQLNADLVIVASPTCQVEELTSNDVKKLFMSKKKSIEEEPITVLDNDDKAVYKDFLKRYLHKSPRKMKVYWTRMLFTGKKVAPKKFSLETINTLDLNTSCYMTYVELEDKPNDWTVVTVK